MVEFVKWNNTALEIDDSAEDTIIISYLDELIVLNLPENIRDLSKNHDIKVMGFRQGWLIAVSNPIDNIKDAIKCLPS